MAYVLDQLKKYSARFNGQDTTTRDFLYQAIASVLDALVTLITGLTAIKLTGDAFQLWCAEHTILTSGREDEPDFVFADPIVYQSEQGPTGAFNFGDQKGIQQLVLEVQLQGIDADGNNVGAQLLADDYQKLIVSSDIECDLHWNAQVTQFETLYSTTERFGFQHIPAGVTVIAYDSDFVANPAIFLEGYDEFGNDIGIQLQAYDIHGFTVYSPVECDLHWNATKQALTAGAPDKYRAGVTHMAAGTTAIVYTDAFIGAPVLRFKGYDVDGNDVGLQISAIGAGGFSITTPFECDVHWKAKKPQLSATVPDIERIGITHILPGDTTITFTNAFLSNAGGFYTNEVILRNFITILQRRGTPIGITSEIKRICNTTNVTIATMDDTETGWILGVTYPGYDPTVTTYDLSLSFTWLDLDGAVLVQVHNAGNHSNSEIIALIKKYIMPADIGTLVVTFV